MRHRTQPSSRRRIGKRGIGFFLGLLVVLCLVAFGGAAWYFSSKVLDVSHGDLEYAQRVLALRGNAVEITRTSDTIQPGTYRLQWHGGQVILGTVISSTPDGVWRQFTGDGRRLTIGLPVHFDTLMYASPASFHVAFRTVEVPGPLGAMPAWFIPGTRHIWVILVHGREMARTEGLVVMPPLLKLGLPILDMTYRNDIGAPASSDHLYHLGDTEWQDVQAGVRFALDHGARGVVLYGYSMGGTAVEAFIHRSVLVRSVRATVLDSPALDWNAALELAARQNSVPNLLLDAARDIITWRIGVRRLDDISGVRSAADFRVPTLLFQGTADTDVPFDRNAALARGRPDLVTFIPVYGAQHTHEWNVSPSAYDAHVRAFLTRVLK